MSLSSQMASSRSSKEVLQSRAGLSVPVARAREIVRLGGRCIGKGTFRRSVSQGASKARDFMVLLKGILSLSQDQERWGR